MKFFNILFNIFLILFSTTIHSITNPHKAIINLTSGKQNVNLLETFLNNRDFDLLNDELKLAELKLLKTGDNKHVILSNKLLDEFYREKKLNFYPIKRSYLGSMDLSLSDIQSLIEEAKNKISFLEFIDTNYEENEVKKILNKIKRLFKK